VFFGWDEGPSMSRRWITIGQSFLSGLLILLGAAAPFAANRVEEVQPWIIFTVAGLLLAIGIATLWAVVTREILAASILPAVGFTVAFLFVAVAVYPAANTFKSSRDFAEIIKKETADSRAAGQEILALDLGNLPIHYAFYTDGIYTIETKDVTDLERHLDRDERVWAVANAKRLDELSPEILERIEIVATTRASRRDVALITNQPSRVKGEE
jgi:hypothetical protein